MYGNNGPQDGYYGGSGDRAAWGDQGYGSSSTEYYRAYSAPVYDAGYRSASPPPAPVDGYGYGAQGYGYSGGYSERVIGRPGEPGFGSPVRGGYDGVQVNQRYGGGYGGYAAAGGAGYSAGGGGYGAAGGYAGGYDRYGRAGDAGYNYQAGSGQVQRWNGEAGAGGSFGFLRYADTSSRNTGPPVVNEVRWNDDTILSLNHYHHGDHHHHHHQRQVHHFHDMHLMGSADETLDLRNTPDVQTNVIGTDAPPQLRLRPDDVGRNAFCDLQKQISTGPGSLSFGPYPAQPPPPTAEPYSPRFDPAPRPPPSNSYWSSPRGRTFSL